MNNRRKLLVALGVAGSWPHLALAQSKQPVVIGWLSAESREASRQNLEAFKQGLATLGWKNGAQYVIEERWANGKFEQLRPLAEELAAKRPALIVVGALRGVNAAVKAAHDTPIVSASAGDLVAAGHAASLARPGGLVTGLTNFRRDIAEKFLELLLAAVPKLKRIGFLGDSNAANHPLVVAAVRRSLKQYPIEARFVDVSKPDDIEPAFAALVKDRVQGLIVISGLATYRQRIVSLALKQRWPLMASDREYTEEGALLSYAVDTSANYRRAAYYVDKILKGAKPGDLPIEQPTKLELVVNMKTAKALGLTIPQLFLMRADKVIE